MRRRTQSVRMVVDRPRWNLLDWTIPLGQIGAKIHFILFLTRSGVRSREYGTEGTMCSVCQVTVLRLPSPPTRRSLDGKVTQTTLKFNNPRTSRGPKSRVIRVMHR
jgi:hypothetical protein